MSAVAVVAALELGAVAWRATRPAPPRPLMRLSVEIGSDAGLSRVRQNGMLALSPDGTRLALTYHGANGKSRLGTRLLQQSQITPLSGTDEATTPFFSPDGHWIAFFADGKLKKVAVEGGAADTICDAASVRGASWGDDGNIVFAPATSGGLLRVSSDGGTPSPLTKVKEEERSHRWPQVLPGSQAILFTAAASVAGYDDANIEIFITKTGERKTLRRGGFSPHYVLSGHLVYLHESTLFAAPFDLKSLALTGQPLPILEDASSTTTSGGDFDLSQSGLFVYLAGNASKSTWLIQSLDKGNRQTIVEGGRFVEPRISPDGKRLAYSMGNGMGTDLWVKDLERNTQSRLSFLGDLNDYPVWTPDGRAIVFKSQTHDKPGVYWMHSDGSGEAVRLTDGKVILYPTSFSPDASFWP